MEGTPWLVSREHQSQYRGGRISIEFEIWFGGGGCPNRNLKNYKVLMRNRGGGNFSEIFKWNDEIPRKLQSTLPGFPARAYVWDRCSRELANGDCELDENNEDLSNYKRVALVIDSLEEDSFGEYVVKNEVGQSEVAVVKEIVDGYHDNWSVWSGCSTTCSFYGYEREGVRTRTRKCKPPLNGGKKCPGENSQTSHCGQKLGDMAPR